MAPLADYEVKTLSISQRLVQAARPRPVIAPILFGLGVQLEKAFKTKWLVHHIFNYS